MGVETLMYISAAISVATTVYALANQPDIEDPSIKLDKRGTKAPRIVPYGKCRISGTKVWSTVADLSGTIESNKGGTFNWTNESQACFVYSLGVGEIECIHQVFIDDIPLLKNENTPSPIFDNDKEFDLFKSTEVSDDIRGAQRLYMQFRYGKETETSISMFNPRNFGSTEGFDYSNGEWTIDHRGDRVPQIAFVAEADVSENAPLKSGKQNITALVSGLKIHDPRYHLAGEKSFNHESPVPTTYRQCGRNPALILLDFLTDEYYGMKIPSNYFNVSTFTATANWTDETGIYLDGSVDTSSTFGEILSSMLSTFQGVLVIENGLISCKYEDVVVAPYATTFNEDNIIEIKDNVGLSDSNYYNVVEVEYQNEQNNYNPDVYQIPADINGDTRVQNDGFIKSKKIELPMTVDNIDGTVDGTVKILANRAYARLNLQKGVTIVVNLAEHQLSVYDVIKITNDKLGWTDKLFRISTIGKSVDNDNFNLGELVCIEYNPSIYSGSLVGFTGTNSGVPLVGRTLAPVEFLGFNLTNYNIDGIGILSWDDANIQQEDGTNPTTFIVSYKLSSETNWTYLTTVDDPFCVIPNLKNVDYDFRVFCRRVGMIDSEAVVIINQTINSTVQLPPISNLIQNVQGRDFLYSWDDMLDTPVNNTFDPTDPSSAGTSGNVRDYFKYYEVKVYNGVNLRGTYQVTDPFFTYKLEDNISHTINRNIKIDVSVVSRDGSKSAIVSTDNTNTQMGVVTNVSAIDRLESSDIFWDLVNDSDYDYTEVHVSTTFGFTPSVGTLYGTTRNDNFTYVFPSGDATPRYVRLGHKDVFGTDSMVYSQQILMTYVAISTDYDDSVLIDAVSDLNDEMDQVQSDVAGIVTDLSVLDDVKVLQQQNTIDIVNNIFSNVENGDDIITEEKVRKTETETLSADLAGANSEITETKQVIVDLDSAVSTRIDELSVNIFDNKASITSVEQAYADADSAIVSDLNILEAEVDDNTGNITELNNVDVSSTSALVQSHISLTGEVGDNTADITQVNFVDVSSTSALVQAHLTLDGTITDPTTGLVAAHGEIDQINNVDVGSTSALVQDYLSLKGVVNNPTTGLVAAHGEIDELNFVDVSSTSALVQSHLSLSGAVNDPVTGLAAATADILEINNVDVSSTSAVASSLATLSGAVNDPITGLAAATADIVDINTIDVNSDSALASAVAYLSANVGDNSATSTFTQSVKATADGAASAITGLRNAITNDASDDQAAAELILNSTIQTTGELVSRAFLGTTVVDGDTERITGIIVEDGTNTKSKIEFQTDTLALVNTAGEVQFYWDDTAGKFIFKGDLSAAGGTFSGDLSAAGSTFSGTIYAENIEGDVVDNIIKSSPYTLGTPLTASDNGTTKTLFTITIQPATFDRILSIGSVQFFVFDESTSTFGFRILNGGINTGNDETFNTLYPSRALSPDSGLYNSRLNAIPIPASASITTITIQVTSINLISATKLAQQADVLCVLYKSGSTLS